MLSVLKKFLLGLLIFLLLLVASVLFLPYIFKDKIIENIKIQANKELKANLDFNKNVSISLFKSFPNLHISLSDVLINSRDTIFGTDTIVYGKNISLTFDIKELYKNKKYVVRELDLKNPIINLEVSKDGIANWDIVYPDTTEEDSEIIDFQVDHFGITQGYFKYIDLPGNMVVKMDDITHASTGNFNAEIFSLDAVSAIKNVFISYDKVAYVNNISVKQNGKIGVNLKDSEYSFIENTIHANALPIDFVGKIKLNESNMVFDLIAKSKTNDLGEFLTLIPAIYTTDYKNIETKGKSALDFTFKGVMDDTRFPAFSLNLGVKDGYVKYPDFDLPAKDLQFNLNVKSLDGDLNKTIIDLKTLKFNLGGDAFSGHLTMNQIFGDPIIDAAAKGKINLDNFQKMMPLEKGTQLSGSLVSDLEISGPVSAISTNALNKFVAKGTVNSDGLVYQTPSMKEALSVSNATLEFDNHKVHIPLISGKLGRNDATISGTLNNIFAYMLSNETLTGNIKMQSTYFNTNDFISENTPKEESTITELTVVEIPGNLNFEMQASIQKLIYDDLVFDNFSGKTLIQNKTLILQNISTEFLGGTVQVNGNYSVPGVNPRAIFDISYANLAVDKLFKQFNVVRAFAPIAKNFNANTTAKISIATDLDKNMQPILSNIDLGGFLKLESINIEKFDLLQSIDQKLKINKLNTSKLKDFLLNFKISEGKLLVSPFDFLLDSAILSLSGTSFLDGRLNYNGNLQIPAKYLGNNTSVINNLTKGTAFQAYAINPNDFFDLAIKITGNALKPEVSLNLKEIKNNLKSGLKSALDKEIDTRKKQAEDLARKELDNAKNQALDKARIEEARLKAELNAKKLEAETKAKEELEKQKAAADAKIRAETEKKKEELKNAAKDKLDGLFKK